ncbi:hypothetical protein GCM10020001_085600 [Nonomuraea salmonea]
MLYGTPALEAADKVVLAEIEDMRQDLEYRLAETHRWDGQLRRQLQARAIQGSNAIEGYRASVEDVQSIMAGEEPLDASNAVTKEIAGYQQALTYIRSLSRAPAFRYDAGLLNALNFMMIGHHGPPVSGRHPFRRHLRARLLIRPGRLRGPGRRARPRAPGRAGRLAQRGRPGGAELRAGCDGAPKPGQHPPVARRERPHVASPPDPGPGP